MLLSGYFILFTAVISLQFQTSYARRYLGCYKDEGQRLLRSHWVLGPKTTRDSCMAKCAAEGFRFGATQYFVYCFCGNDYPPHERLAPESMCNTPCRGNKAEMCGGTWHENIYDLHESEATSNLLPFVGCFDTLSNSKLISSHIRAKECVLGCKNSNFKYAGIRGSTCHCSSEAPVSDKKPTYPQKCGDAMAVYYAREGEFKKYMGCYKMEKGSWPESTVVRDTTCPELCRRKGLRYSARDSNFRCYCSDERPTYKLMSPGGNCSNVCKDSAFERCPDPGYALVYDLAVGHSYDSQLELKGCYKEEKDSGIVLDGYELILNENTPEQCVGICYNYGYKFAGIKNGNICRCGQDVTESESGTCSSPCPGDSRETCGGNESIAVYPTKTTLEEPTEDNAFGLSGRSLCSSVPWFVVPKK